MQNPRLMLQGQVLNSSSHEAIHGSSEHLKVQPILEAPVQKKNCRKIAPPDSESATERFLKIARDHGLTVTLEKESDKNTDVKEKTLNSKEQNELKPTDLSKGEKSSSDQKVSPEKNPDGVSLLTEAMNSVQITPSAVARLTDNIDPKSVCDQRPRCDLEAGLDPGCSEFIPRSNSDMDNPDDCEAVPLKVSGTEAPVQNNRPMSASRNVNLKLPMMASLLGKSYNLYKNTVEAGVQTDPDLTTEPRFCQECKKEIVALDQQTLSQVLKKVTPEQKYKFTARQASLLLKESPALLEKPVDFQDELLKKLTAFCSRVKMGTNRKEDELVCRLAVQLLIEKSELAHVKNGEEYFKRLKEEVTNMLEVIDSVILDGYKKSNQGKLNGTRGEGIKPETDTKVGQSEKGSLVVTCLPDPTVATGVAGATKVTCIETTPASSLSMITAPVSVSCTSADGSALFSLPASASICLLDKTRVASLNGRYSPNAKNTADTTHVITSLTDLPKKPTVSSLTHQLDLNVTSSTAGLPSSDVFRFTGSKSFSQVSSNATHLSGGQGQASSIFTFSEQLTQKSLSAEPSISLPRKPCDSLVTDVINKLKHVEPPNKVSQFESQKQAMEPTFADLIAVNKVLQCADKPSPLNGAHNLNMNPPLAVDAFRKGSSSSVMSSPLRVSTLEQESHSAFASQKPAQNFSLLNQPTDGKLSSQCDVLPMPMPFDSSLQNVFQHSLHSAYNSTAKVMDFMCDSLPASNSGLSLATASGFDMSCSKNESENSSIVSGSAERNSLGSNSRVLKKKAPLVLKKIPVKVTTEAPVATLPVEPKTQKADWWDVHSEYQYFQKPSGYDRIRSSSAVSSCKTLTRTDRPSKQIYLTPMQRKRNKILAEETNNSAGPCTWDESKYYSTLSHNSDSLSSVSSAAFDTTSASYIPTKGHFSEDTFFHSIKLRADRFDEACDNFDEVFDNSSPCFNPKKAHFSEDNVTEWKKVRADQVIKVCDNYDNAFDNPSTYIKPKHDKTSEDNVTEWKKARGDQADKTCNSLPPSFMFAPDSAAESSYPAQGTTSQPCLSNMSKNATRYSQFNMESVPRQSNETLPENIPEETPCLFRSASIKSLDDIDFSDNGKSYTDVLQAGLDVNINSDCSEKVLKDKLTRKAAAGCYGLDDISLFDSIEQSPGDQTPVTSQANEDFWYKVTGHKEESLAEQLIDFRLQEKYSNLIKLITGIHPFLTKQEATEALELVFETNRGMKGMRQPQILSEVHAAVQELYPDKLKIQEEINKKTATREEVNPLETTELGCTDLSGDLVDKPAPARAKPIKKARRMKRKEMPDLHNKGPMNDSAESSSSLNVSADGKGVSQAASGSLLSTSDNAGTGDVARDDADEVKSLNPQIRRHSLASYDCTNPDLNTGWVRSYNCNYQPRASYAEKNCVIQ
ncbi:hypothetical protein Btru_074949 [Bulinus truncatus]|nr:hypothetical protein Btru_074949 [Bulinus truncatus]